jgi:hypothetical protein
MRDPFFERLTPEGYHERVADGAKLAAKLNDTIIAWAGEDNPVSVVTAGVALTLVLADYVTSIPVKKDRLDHAKYFADRLVRLVKRNPVDPNETMQ